MITVVFGIIVHQRHKSFTSNLSEGEEVSPSSAPLMPLPTSEEFEEAHRFKVRNQAEVTNNTAHSIDGGSFSRVKGAPATANGSFSAVQRAVVNFPFKSPKLEELKLIQPSDADWLLQGYLSQQNLTNRYASLYGLVFSGDPRSFSVITNTLFVEFAGRTLGDFEERAMFRHVEILGYLSRSQPEVLEFIKAHLTPSDWKHGEVRKWNSAFGREDYTDQVLAGSAVVGLALNGQQEGLHAFAELRQRPPSEIYNLTSPMVDAAFAFYYINENSLAAWDELYFDIGKSEAFQKWFFETEEGKQWDVWSREVEALGAGSSN